MGKKLYYLYKFYNVNGELLYIGKTHNPKSRFSQHFAEKPRAGEIDKIMICELKNKKEMDWGEVYLIATSPSKYNVKEVEKRKHDWNGVFFTNLVFHEYVVEDEKKLNIDNKKKKKIIDFNTFQVDYLKSNVIEVIDYHNETTLFKMQLPNITGKDLVYKNRFFYHLIKNTLAECLDQREGLLVRGKNTPEEVVSLIEKNDMVEFVGNTCCDFMLNDLLRATNEISLVSEGKLTNSIPMSFGYDFTLQMFQIGLFTTMGFSHQQFKQMYCFFDKLGKIVKDYSVVNKVGDGEQEIKVYADFSKFDF